ncbi:DMT family transporter [Oceaniserpentilla sp. 4NH20-0058]|uniref:DMT family transporter n=1 Tax=Oceaniserpentilla sp. 4NH20-0058 TaxID=3127660 RepID=UPI0031058BD0
MSPFSLALQTTFALLAFAGNSVLCRLALQDPQIDATSFTIIRLISGAFILVALLNLKIQLILNKPNPRQIRQAAYLFIYAAGFSYAYILLGTAPGALVLFVTVQLAMLIRQFLQGKTLRRLELVGIALAVICFVSWLAPSTQRPDLFGILLMIFAGIAWAFYTLSGKNSQNAQLDTARNFINSLLFIPLIVPLYWWIAEPMITTNGVLLAFTSGAITSGLGYWVWYKVLPNFSALSAGVMQLSVPIIAAIGGILWNNETITLTFFLASLGILSGIFLVLYSGQQAITKKP